MNKRTLTLLAGLFLITGVPGLAQKTTDTPSPSAPSTWCRFVPERLDDFAWENDLTAFRAYGPAIKTGGGPENSGIDCWCKRVPYPIIDKWYAGDKKHISYHKDHGEGYDLYDVGSSRGCGGTAIWKNGQMILAGPFKEWKILSRTPKKSVFTLSYDYNVDGATIHEVKQITIELGERLFRSQSTFTQDGKPAAVDVAVGVTTHDGAAAVTLNPQHGWMSCWETIDGYGLGTGVVIAPNRVVEMREIKSKTPDAGHALLLTKTDAAGQVTFFAGFGWEKAKGITTPRQWQDYLALCAAKIHETPAAPTN